MNKKKIILIILILVILVQLYIPAKMILDKEAVLAKGTEYKFQTEPIDPNDPFRGKYISLRFKENRVHIHDKNEWEFNETIYVLLYSDLDGYAKIKSVSKEKPLNNPDFVEAKISNISGNYSLIINYPFNRFYMDEFKAPIAEDIYFESLLDTNQVTYASVFVKNGDAVIKDVLIDGVSIKDLVKIRNENK